ncbi:MAG: Unknown protein [uncultured Campylobacterales bacterium]|uniref:M23ase beta-sheet core domain-containing protein n=1 Tax=uncultured Campylobacterales bacterium TaxID=352960 RepID=A0A6S6T854_9BACT|nr:MAG: Unknown protein [uncultured Campylobacterales bacterium]
MIKLILILLSLTLFCNADSLDNKILKTQKKSNSTSSKEKKLKTELKDLARDISREEKELKSIKSKIKKLTKKIKTSTNNYEKSVTKEKELGIRIDTIEQKKLSLENNISTLLIKNFSLVKNQVNPSIDDIVTSDIINKVTKISTNSLKELQQSHLQESKKIKSTQKSLTTIKKDIDSYNKKQKKLKSLETKLNSSIKKLGKTKKSYKKQLQILADEKKEIQKILKSLNLEKHTTNKYVSTKDIDNTKVKLVGSSYQKSKVYKYTGKKLLSPIKNATLKRRFGNYTDPIYKIKLFHNSIILKAPTLNAKVRNMADGKIVFASNTKLLKNVVIIKTNSNLNFIYANLDTIAPIVKIGKRLKKGYVLGRVREFLNLEVTYKKYNIDPTGVIKGLK